MVRPVIQPTIELLQEIKLFKAFSEAELKELLSLGKATAAESFENIVIEGEMSWGLYLILGGTVGVFKASQIGNTIYDVGQLEKGSFFGEMSLIDDQPRSATVRAVTPCQLFFLSKEAFQRFLSNGTDRKNRFYETCIKSLIFRLRELNDSYVVSQYQLWKTALNGEEVA